MNNKGLIVFLYLLVLILVIILLLPLVMGNKKENKENKNNNNKNIYDVKEPVDNISKAKLSSIRSSALGYISNIDSFIPMVESAEYIGDSSYQGVEIPINITCIKTSSGWNNEKCSNFYTKLDSKNVGKKPDSATILIGSDHHVSTSNLSLTFGKYTCTYVNDEMVCK